MLYQLGAASQFQQVGRYATSTEMLIYFSDISLQNQIVDIIVVNFRFRTTLLLYGSAYKRQRVKVVEAIVSFYLWN